MANTVKITKDQLTKLVNEVVAEKLKENPLGPVQNPGTANARVDGIVTDMKNASAKGQLTDISGINWAVQNGVFGPSEYEYLFSQLEKAGLGEWAQKARRFLGANNPQKQAPGQPTNSRMGESMKITKEQLTKIVNETVKAKLTSILTEAEAPKPEPGTSVPNAKAVTAWLGKIDALFLDIVERSKALADEGEGMIQENLLNAAETGTRNELIINRIGVLRSVANNLSTYWERMRRYLP